ncbi:MAG: 30S ribosome-binding factor RbfA [Syntrophomonadaceae bacterium]|nr:30S ribosome-binding factor RbfA [Syntrophomonadaceae bacterium]
MNKRRLDKLAEEIKREISAILTEEVKDPRISMVSVTRVEVSNDLGAARVMLSILGDEKKQAETMQALEKARGFIRTELSNRIRLRQTPEINFRLDRSIEHGIRISSIIDELNSDRSGRIE